MAMIPVYDELGNIIRWDDTLAGGTNITPSDDGGSRLVNPQEPGYDRTLGGTRPNAPAVVGDTKLGKASPVTMNFGPSEPSLANDTREYHIPDDTGSGGSGFTAGESFIWPEFDPGPAFQAPAPFSYEEFRAPTLDDAKAEPGYEFARSEGLRGLQNSAASRGVARTGGTLKDLIGWGNRFAEQNYGNVFNRNAQTYDRNRNNAADAYQTNYGISRDVFDRGYTQRKDVFQPKMRAAELTFNDLFARWKAELDATTNIATSGAGL